MKKNLWSNTMGLLGILFSMTIISCNKDVDSPVPNDRPVYPTGIRVASILNDPNYSLLKAAVERAATSSASPSIASLLSDSSLTFTLFAPNNAAFIASGVDAAVINNFSPLTLDTVLRYHIIPQAVPASSLLNAPSPNLQYPSLLNPVPTLSGLFRLTTFLKASSNGAWINNIPIIKVDSLFSNGIIHQVAGIVMPPSKNLWQTIDKDPQLTYLKAAINKADSAALTKDSLRVALRNIGLNATIFAPTDEAFKFFLIEALTSKGVPKPLAEAIVNSNGVNMITNPASITSPIPIPNLGAEVASVITARNVKGIIVYHVISSKNPPHAPPGLRYFTVNIPTTSTLVKTLLNADTSALLRNHPGIAIAATFTGPFVTAASVKGLANPAAANVIISPPPSNTHDLHHTNGVIHKIDQVLLPSPL